ncbi:MAG: hypothetical protein QW057_08625 [Candidatus Bathyarchaeia archaeon]
MSLFDTTFLADLVNGDPGAGRIAEKLAREEAYVGLSTLSAHEYTLGIYHQYGAGEGRHLKSPQRGSTT